MKKPGFLHDLKVKKRLGLVEPSEDICEAYQKKIDLVALNIDTKEIMFTECKWSENIDTRKILRQLKKKAEYVQWHNNTRKEYYAIFA